MAKMDWDRVRREKLTQVRGTACAEEDDSGGDGPLGSQRDEPYWPAFLGRKAGEANRSRESRTDAAGVYHAPLLVVFFDTFASLSLDNARFEECSDQEMRDCRDICHLIMNRLSGIKWTSDTKCNCASVRGLNSSEGQKTTKIPVLIAILMPLDLFTKDGDELNACTNFELLRFRDICQTTIDRVSIFLLKRESATHFTPQTHS